MRQLPWNDDVAATVASLRALAPAPAEVQTAAAAIVDDVRARGDAAVRAQTARLDRVELDKDYAVPTAEMAARLAALAPELRDALETAAANIRAYHEREAVAPWRATLAQGQVVGQEVVPLAVAGLYVPGGLADYPSTVLMTAIPARVAGVEDIVVCSPPRPGGGAAAGVAAACALLGIERLYPIGGAQAVAAMALGTDCVPRCDVIVGPGNAYVTEAKRLLVGEVGIDSLAGPSEVLIIADASGEPEWLAADLLAQAEHGSGAMACLVDIGGTLAGPVAAAVERVLRRVGHRHGQRGRRRLSRPRRGAAAEQRVRARAPGTALRGCPGPAARHPQRRRGVRRPSRRHRVRRLRRRHQPRAAHRRLRPLRPGALRRRFPQAHGCGRTRRPQPPPRSRHRWRPSPTRRACARTRSPPASGPSEELT